MRREKLLTCCYNSCWVTQQHKESQTECKTPRRHQDQLHCKLYAKSPQQNIWNLKTLQVVWLMNAFLQLSSKQQAVEVASVSWQLSSSTRQQARQINAYG